MVVGHKVIGTVWEDVVERKRVVGKDMLWEVVGENMFSWNDYACLVRGGSETSTRKFGGRRRGGRLGGGIGSERRDNRRLRAGIEGLVRGGAREESNSIFLLPICLSI